MRHYFLYLTIPILFIFTSPAYAYLDPGTGSIILQAILAFIAASIATISFYWTKVKIFFSNLFKKKKKIKEYLNKLKFLKFSSQNIFNLKLND